MEIFLLIAISFNVFFFLFDELFYFLPTPNLPKTPVYFNFHSFVHYFLVI